MPKKLGPCGNGSCGNPGKHLCSGCGEEVYCTKECQKAHWATHKYACKTAVKPEAAALMKSFDGFSIKQLKNLVAAKAAGMDPKHKETLLYKLEHISEKNDLVKLCQENVTLSEVENLLSGTAATSKPVSVAPVAVSSSGRGSGSSRNGKYVLQEAPPGTVPTPDQMRQQAAMMRSNPGSYDYVSWHLVSLVSIFYLKHV
jgi:hypothetical protein